MTNRTPKNPKMSDADFARCLKAYGAKTDSTRNNDDLRTKILADYDAQHRFSLSALPTPRRLIATGALSMAACLLAGVFAAPYIAEMLTNTLSAAGLLNNFEIGLQITSIELWNH